MDVRQGKSCTRTNTSCKKQMTEEINTAYDNKANVLIETTGKKIPIDYVNQFVGYNVVFVYSIVSIENLVERNAKRANTKFQEYIKDTAENPAPRVVDVSEKTFNQKVKEIVNTLKFLRGICMKIQRSDDPNISKCGNIKDSNIFNLILVDNNEQEAKIVYDHTKTDRFLSDAEFEKKVVDIMFKTKPKPKPKPKPKSNSKSKSK